MAEIPCNVYDIFHPTPVSLKELSAITIGFEIWRSQVNKLRTSGALEDYDFFLPDLPHKIHDIIYEFRRRFSISINHWKRSHYKRIFQYHRAYPDSVLEDFDDFVIDFNGSIHYVRTAERMMRSDRLSEAEKFKIACTYFFEDDIRRIWPSVCESLDLKDFEVYKSPQVYYWIGCLRNHSKKLRTPNLFHSVDDEHFHSVDDGRMLNYCLSDNRPSVEYFWAKLPLESQLQKASDLYRRHEVVSFVRFILPKLDDQRLSEFVNTKACEFMRDLLESGFAHQWLWIPTWMYIMNKMYQSTVKNVVVEMLRLESGAFANHLKTEPKNWFDFCSVVWNSIPFDWKRSMIEDILSNSDVLKERPRCSDERLSWGYSYVCDHSFSRFITFLFIILSSATSEQRRDFWHKCWPHFIERTRCEDLHQIMKLCLVNEDEIAQFIDKNMANSDHVRDVCVELLKKAHFNQLNDLIDFCHPETAKAMNFKQQLLRTTLYVEDSHYGVAFFGILKWDCSGLKELTTFIDNAFGSIDLSVAFKNELMSSSVILANLPCDPCWSTAIIDTYIELVETFTSSQQNVKDIKALMIRRLTANLSCTRPSIDRILLWCLESEENVREFKLRYLKPPPVPIHKYSKQPSNRCNSKVHTVVR